LGLPSSPYRNFGRVADSHTGIGVPGVTVTFSAVSGSGAVPAPIVTDADGRWTQTGFEPGTTYRATPSRDTYAFYPPSQDFSTIGSLFFYGVFVECSTVTPTPIATGETKTGAIEPTDCLSVIYGSPYRADLYVFTGTAGDQVFAYASS